MHGRPLATLCASLRRAVALATSSQMPSPAVPTGCATFAQRDLQHLGPLENGVQGSCSNPPVMSKEGTCCVIRSAKCTTPACLCG